jgi:hypothetical protein
MKVSTGGDPRMTVLVSASETLQLQLAILL